MVDSPARMEDEQWSQKLSSVATQIMTIGH